MPFFKTLFKNEITTFLANHGLLGVGVLHISLWFSGLLAPEIGYSH